LGKYPEKKIIHQRNQLSVLLHLLASHHSEATSRTLRSMTRMELN
jgi:hypothetical protein